MGFAGQALHDLYYALLLKDLGCSSNAARMSQLYAADDLSFKRAFKKLDTGIAPALAFVFRETGREADLATKFRAVANILKNGPALVNELIETRCTRGAAIARRLRFSDAVANAIHSLDEHWDGGGHPEGLSGAAIPLGSRIALLSQVIEVFWREGRTRGGDRRSQSARRPLVRSRRSAGVRGARQRRKLLVSPCFVRHRAARARA